MPTTIPNLWPTASLKVDVLTPAAILRVQAAELADATKGLLSATISTETSDKGEVRHYFEVTAPALDNYTVRILILSHKIDFVYPVYIESAEVNGYAPTEEQFTASLRQVLNSGSVISIIQSLIARSNDAGGVAA